MMILGTGQTSSGDKRVNTTGLGEVWTWSCIYTEKAPRLERIQLDVLTPCAHPV
ncbi:hypothetical protein BC826DRAFT_1028708 [Russula brevipes]|nr:hypothetical protein BC826DRAFT_1028708 [Russula brevipes]